MSDLVERLRTLADYLPEQASIFRESADEIERLRESLKGATVIANTSGSLLKEHEATIEQLRDQLAEAVKKRAVTFLTQD